MMRTKRHFVGWKYDTGSPGRRYHEADTLAAAIRDAGVSCSTCKHWKDRGEDRAKCMGFVDDITHRDNFCCDHTLLTKPSEEKE